jgi:hypothetical protein
MLVGDLEVLFSQVVPAGPWQRERLRRRGKVRILWLVKAERVDHVASLPVALARDDEDAGQLLKPATLFLEPLASLVLLGLVVE